MSKIIRTALIFLAVCTVILAQAPSNPKQIKQFGNIPPAFEENKGQVDQKARYFLRGGNLNLFVTSTGAVVTVRKDDTRAAVRLDIVGASGNGTVEGESRLPGQASYFRGNDASKWITAVPTYEKVRISEVRHGVDVLYYANGRKLEYDLIVKPGTDPREVKLRFEGAEKLSLSPEGDLRIETAAGELIQHKPEIWQLRDGRREAVGGRYRVSDAGEVSVRVDRYDHGRELVIDPVVSYATFLDGGQYEGTNAIALDSMGDTYVTGFTSSADFPTTVGAYSVALKGANTTDVFVSKLNTTGTALVYSTFIGGSGNDSGAAITIDTSGNAYITGYAYSTDFPVTSGVLQTTGKNSAVQSAFVAKLNAAGTALLYSTYLGGSNSQNGTAIKADASGNAYVAGVTNSTDFPVTAGAYSTVFPGLTPGFVAKLNPTATQLVYSTYLGGVAPYTVVDLALDTSLNAYVAGTANSAGFPTTTGAYQVSPSTGVVENGFIAEISTDGTSLIASTLLGCASAGSEGSSTVIYALALDSGNNPYVTGYTENSSFPTTQGAFSTSFAGTYYYDSHAFVTKLNSSLSSLAYSTFLAGAGSEQGNAIAVDSAGRAYVAGYTNSTNFPITPGSLLGQKNPAGSESAFLTQLDPTGSTLDYSTLLAGTGGSIGLGVAVAGNQGVYLTGFAGSADFPVTAGALQTTAPSFQIFVAKIDLSSPTTCNPSISPSSYTAPLGGGTSSFAIAVPQGCPWVLYNSSPNSVTINGPTHGYGNATVSFTVASNAGITSPVSTSILLGASAFSISQPPATCSTPVLTPASASFSYMGGLGQFSIAIPSGCSYTAVSSASWLTFTSGSTGSGSGQVNYLVAVDDFASRSATVSVAGTTLSVTQTGSGCTASAVGNAGAGAAGGTGLISLTTSASTCAWNASSLSPWIQLSTTSGTGSTTLGVVLAPNPGTAARTGQVQIAGQTVTFGQAPGPFEVPAAYTISTLAGTGVSGFSGDGGPANAAMLNYPYGIAYDSSGDLYIADLGNARIRQVDLNGNISTIAGNGTGTDTGNGGPATAASLASPQYLAIGPEGNIFIVENFLGGTANDDSSSVREITDGIISPLSSSSGQYNLEDSIAVDGSNNVYVGGYAGIRKISASGQVTTFAGSGTLGFSGDNGSPTAATISYVYGTAIDSSSNFYLSDTDNQRIRRIANNVITTVAGNGTAGFNGDGPGTTTTLDYPGGMTVDPTGNVIFVDGGDLRVRRLTPGGNITTIAGNGNYSSGSNGDGGPALSAEFNYPSSVAIDPFGNIAVSEPGSNRVRLLTPSYSFCGYALGASTASAPVALSSLSASVTTATGCAWNAYSTVSWITFTSASGTGSGTATLQIAANTTGSARTGVAIIAGQTFTVTQSGVPSVPAIVSLTPTSGAGGSQVFTAVFSDSAGAAALTDQEILIAPSLTDVGACLVTYNANGFFLVNDAGTGQLGPLASGGTLANSQCTLTADSVTNSGNNSTVSYSISFKNAYYGPKSIYLYADDNSGAKTGYLYEGTYTTGMAGTLSTGSLVSSGTGTTLTFTAQYGDTAGASLLVDRELLIAPSLTDIGACLITYNANGFFLVNNAGNGQLGPLQSGGTLSNSQCTLNSTGTSASSSGNTATVVYSVTFQNAYFGTKAAYLYADDAFGNNTGYVAKGSVTLGTGTPSTVSLSPTTGSGTTQTFTATFSDTGGAAALVDRELLIAPSLTDVGACLITYNANGFFLVNDAGNGQLGPMASGGSLSNSQCTLNRAGTGVTNSGNTSVVTYSVTFQSGYFGQKDLFLYADDVFGGNTGYGYYGQFTAGSGMPGVVSVTPSTGSGLTQSFTATFSEAGGASVLNDRELLIAGSLTDVNACLITYNANGFFLVNNAGNGQLGPLTPGGTLSNSQCTLNGTGTSANGLTVTYSVTFSNTYFGAKTLYLYADDLFGNTTGYQVKGAFTVGSGTPSVISVTPGTGGGTAQTFTAVYSQTLGTSALVDRELLVAPSLTDVGACLVTYNSNGFYLVNDAGNNQLGPIAAGSGATLSNSQCTLNGSGSGVSNSGNNSTVTFSLTFQNSFAGVKNLYLYADDVLGNNTTYQTAGNYAVGTGTPFLVSLTPNYGGAASQIFSAVFSNTSDANIDNNREILFASSLTDVNACLITYNSTGFYLVNDAGNGQLGPMAPGGSLSNSQCTLNSSGTGATFSGQFSTVTYAVTFQSSYTGLKNVYLYADDFLGHNTGYQLYGRFTP